MRKNSRIKKNLIKGFTLIELLVVVAIIGVLAAVGVTAFQGFVESSKVSAMKNMHAGALKKIAAELQKCNMGESKMFQGTRANGNTYAGQDCHATSANTNAARAKAGFQITSTDKNPWKSNENAYASGTRHTIGRIVIQSTGPRVIVKTCWKDPCGTTGNSATGVAQAE